MAEVENVGENPYLAVITKKIRALKKKLVTIEGIEKKRDEGVKINAEQSSKLATKKSILEGVKEFESIRDQFQKMQQDEKSNSSDNVPEVVEKEEDTTVQTLVTLFQITRFFSEKQYPRDNLAETELTVQDLENLNSLYRIITGFSASVSNNIEEALHHARQFISGSEEELFEGVTYRSLGEKIRVAATKSIPAEAPAQAPVEERKETPEPELQPTQGEQRTNGHEQVGEEGREGGEAQGFIDGEKGRRGRGRGFRPRRGGRGGSRVEGVEGEFQEKREKDDRRGDRRPRPDRSDRPEKSDKPPRTTNGERGGYRGRPRGGRGGDRGAPRGGEAKH